MIIRTCETCHKPRWAKTYPLHPRDIIKTGGNSVARTRVCKGCRKKLGPVEGRTFRTRVRSKRIKHKTAFVPSKKKDKNKKDRKRGSFASPA